MGKSVKLTDGSYIDSSAIWDVNRGKTQEEMNKRVFAYGTVTEVTFGGNASEFLIFFKLPTAPDTTYSFRVSLTGAYKVKLNKDENGTYSTVWTLS